MPQTKHSASGRIGHHPGRIRAVLLPFAGILLFAGFIHHSFPLLTLAIGGLASSALVIGYTTRHGSLFEVFGIRHITRKVIFYTLPAIALGIILGILTRRRFDLTLLPAGFTGVVFVAPLIGAMEELVFRGYFQGQLRSIGAGFSVLTASVLHTLYKLLVILSLDTPLQFDLSFLIFWTFLAGILIGTLRELSGSTLPSVMAHAVFDIVLYGGMATAPVWVWS